MKKVVLTIIVAVFVCLMALCVGAKTITTASNQTESSAVSIEFGDTGVIYGQLNYDDVRFYKLTIPYNGGLTISGRLTCDKKTPNINATYYFYIYNSANDLGEQMLSFKTSASTDCSSKKTISIPKGTYVVRIDDGFYKPDNPTLYFTFSFQCSHIETEEVTVRKATCSEEGYVEERCTECKEVIDSYDLDKLDHTSESEWTITKETSCAEAGERVKYCTVCGEEAKVEEIDPPDHTWTDWTVTKEATCAEEGSKYRTCSACGYRNEREIESPEHKWSNWEILTKANCEEEGLRTHTCSACNKEERETIEKEEHRFGSWKTTKNATETSKGEKERTCKDCEYVETQAIDKLTCGEEYSWETTKKATCTTNGTKKKVCDYCGKTLATETIYADGHEWDDWKITREPTKTRDGEKERECIICGETEEKAVTLTHGDFGEWRVAKQATCEEAGKKEFVCYCCNKVTESETIKKTGHSYGEWTVEKAAAPEKDGTQIAKCKNCGETKSETVKYDFESLKKQAKKQHKFSDVKVNSWFNEVVGNCYHYGLMVGTSETTFNPSGNITRAEVITSAVRIYCLTNPDENKPVMTASPWYKGYVDYAIQKGIIKANDFDNYTVPATRAEMAYIFVNAVGEEELEKINTVTEIPDVKTGDKYAKEIFMLYNAGVLTGSDEKGTFNPNNNIVRSESAAIIARISKISDRVKK